MGVIVAVAGLSDDLPHEALPEQGQREQDEGLGVRDQVHVLV